MSKKRVIAKVDGSEIYFWQYEDTMASFATEVLRKNIEQLTPTEYETCSKESLNKVIANELFYLDGFDAGIEVSNTDIEMMLEEFKKFFSQTDYNTFLLERDMTELEFRDYVRKQLIKDRYINALLKKIPEAGSEEIESFYQKVKDKISLPPQFSFIVAYIDSNVDADKERFKSLLSNIATKKVDSEIAVKILEDIKLAINGVNVVSYEKKSVEEMNPQVKQLLLSIEDGCFSPIYEAPDEVSIFYMKKKELNIPMTEEEGRKEAERYYKVVRLKKILDAYVESLKEKRKIEVFL